MACGIYLNRETSHVTAHLKEEVTATALRGHNIKIEYTLLTAGSCGLLLTAAYHKGRLGLNGLGWVETLKFRNEQRDAGLGARLESLVLHEEFVTA